MNCFKCKHFDIKYNPLNIKDSSYCKKFGCFTKTLEEKIKTENINCCEEGENWFTEWSKKAAYNLVKPDEKWCWEEEKRK